MGNVRLSGKKLGVESFNFYLRLSGETQWQRVARAPEPVPL